MNSKDKLQKSLAPISSREQVLTSPGFDISEVLNFLDASFFSQFAGLEVVAGGEVNSYYRYGMHGYSDEAVAVTEVNPVAPEEVYFLTQVILNTLNTEPARYHDMFDIPGLETEGWEKVADVAQYLISQGWIEPKATEERLLVKLTLEGRLYLRNTNAWS